MRSPIVTVGVTGGTGAGKTSLCRLLARAVGEVTIVDLDSYYLDRSGLSPEMRSRLNFDEPSAFDLPLLLRHVRELREGRPVEKPEYSFASHVRCGASRVAPGRLIVVEGLLALWWEDLRTLLDLKVFVDAPEATRLARRIERDLSTRGRTVASVRQQFATTVRPMHAQYVEPARALADLVVVNDRDDLSGCVAQVRSALQTLAVGAQRER